MTMHLEGPWLSTTGKKRGKQKWASTEHKKQAQELDEAWKAKMAAWGVEAEQKKQRRAMTAPALKLKISVPPGRATEHIASLNTGWAPCVKPADKVYTGTKVKGIGTMHKSNAVPIFSDEEAVDISKMRR